MPFVTSASRGLTDTVAFTFENREDALLKAAEIAGAGAESVSVADVGTGEILAGPDLLAAIENLVRDA